MALDSVAKIPDLMAAADSIDLEPTIEFIQEQMLADLPPPKREGAVTELTPNWERQPLDEYTVSEGSGSYDEYTADVDGAWKDFAQTHEDSSEDQTYAERRRSDGGV
jgi:hypothetical protein